MNPDNPTGSVDRNLLSFLESDGDAVQIHDSRNSILPRNYCTMGEHTSELENDGSGREKERRPGRIHRASYKDISALQSISLAGMIQDPNAPACSTRADSQSFEASAI